MRPLIGIPSQADFREGSKRPIYCNNRTYVQAVESAGGVPVLIPMLHDFSALEPLLDHLDGILFSGGVDLEPHLYHEDALPLLGEVDFELDDFELSLARWALARDIPLLGVCRGMQLLNVVLGGTLYQDVHAQCPETIVHSRRELSRNTLIHEIHVAEGSLMEKALGTRELWMNSLHHQAVKDAGEGVFISGRSPDGVAELMEVPGHRFILGIQGHPEELFTTEVPCANLFSAFVAACSAYNAYSTTKESDKVAVKV
jgi:putative glutamine amidotransferase